MPDFDVTLVVRPTPTAQVDVVQDFPVTISAGVAGPAGRKGDKGDPGPMGPSGGDGYTHDQAVPTEDVIISHNLARYPSVTVVDSGGTEVIGDVQYLDENRVRISFSAPFAFVAYLN